MRAEAYDKMKARAVGGFSILGGKWVRRVSGAIVVGYICLGLFVYVVDAFGIEVGFLSWEKIVGGEYEGPSVRHIFGTDFMGRSVFRKTLCSARVSVTVAGVGAMMSVFIGVVLGSLAGFLRGWVDRVVIWLYMTLSVVPYILLIMVFSLVFKDVEFFGSAEVKLSLALGLTGWTSIARIIRGESIRHGSLDYVRSARAYGFSRVRIAMFHILPNLAGTVKNLAILRFVYFIHAEVMLSFLGLGANDRPSWGRMIDLGRADMTMGCWWEMSAAVLAVAVISIALNLLVESSSKENEMSLGI